MNKPEWTTGEILWSENYNDETSETFGQAWLRLFGESRTYEPDEVLAVFKDETGSYKLFSKGRVCYYHAFGGNIQLDPTYEEDEMILVTISPTVIWKFDKSEVITSTLIDSNFSSYDDFRKQLKDSFFANLM